jgi:BirA family transcriptional regulator, biotin operon repressor / biotin---[acetyl-CoA-carboxylase] ligase
MSESAHLHWGAEALWQRLSPLLPGLSVEVQARTDSTNTRLIERARAASGDRDAPITRPGQIDAHVLGSSTPHGRRMGDLEPCLLVAEHQTRGRGRLGRDWQSKPAASLTFSLALPLAPLDWSGLSLAVGLAIAEALDGPGEAALPPGIGTGSGREPAALPRIGLKWPNDLWLIGGAGTGRKLGGILIETVSVGRRRMCVVGVGLNVLAQAFEGVDAAWLAEIDPTVDPPAALGRVAEPLVRALLQFEREGFAPLVERYARRDVLAGQPVSTNAADAPEGIAEGVDANGALLLRVGQTLHRIVSGEVSVRLADAGVSVDGGN